ncbi:MAG: SAM-dependent methyltransferase, partial [Chloroflexota bacterium]
MNKFVALNEDLIDYVRATTSPTPDVLTRLRTASESLPRGHMLIPPEQAAFFAMLLKLMNARRVLEIGVFTGYSALAYALALPDDGDVVGLDFG